MSRKKMLLCFSVIGILSVLPFNGSYAEESVLNIKKPEIIEDSSLSGKLDSNIIQSQENNMNVLIPSIENSGVNSSGGLTGGSTGDRASDKYNLMAPDAILGNQDVTIESFGELIISRLLDVVSFFQKFAKPFTIIMFILSALLSLVSLVFGTNKVKTGLLGIMLSILAYVGVMYAPDIVLFFAQWLSV